MLTTTWVRRRFPFLSRSKEIGYICVMEKTQLANYRALDRIWLPCMQSTLFYSRFNKYIIFLYSLIYNHEHLTLINYFLRKTFNFNPSNWFLMTGAFFKKLEILFFSKVTVLSYFMILTCLKLSLLNNFSVRNSTKSWPAAVTIPSSSRTL